MKAFAFCQTRKLIERIEVNEKITELVLNFAKSHLACSALRIIMAGVWQHIASIISVLYTFFD